MQVSCSPNQCKECERCIDSKTHIHEAFYPATCLLLRFPRLSQLFLSSIRNLQRHPQTFWSETSESKLSKYLSRSQNSLLPALHSYFFYLLREFLNFTFTFHTNIRQDRYVAYCECVCVPLWISYLYTKHITKLEHVKEDFIHGSCFSFLKNLIKNPREKVSAYIKVHTHTHSCISVASSRFLKF